MTKLSESQLVEREEGAVVSSDKSIFESRDPGFLTDSGDGDTGKKYTGPERRRENRRQKDRREEVRFDPNSKDRRQKEGRRADDKQPKFW
jgi:hypothetical protein